jgi:uncharacterized protein (TIGR03086 family)
VDPINLFQRAVDQTGRIVAGVKPDQLGDATPCSDWKVRDLLNHLIACVKMFDGSAQTKPFDPSAFGEDNVGTDPAASYDAAASTLRATIAKPGIIDNAWTMPFGEVPGPVGAGFATLEISQHGWDVARATGQQIDFDPEVTDAAFATARLAPPEVVRTQGVFGPEIECSNDVPAQDQLAAFLGRII